MFWFRKESKNSNIKKSLSDREKTKLSGRTLTLLASSVSYGMMRRKVAKSNNFHPIRLWNGIDPTTEFFLSSEFAPERAEEKKPSFAFSHSSIPKDCYNLLYPYTKVIHTEINSIIFKTSGNGTIYLRSLREERMRQKRNPRLNLNITSSFLLRSGDKDFFFSQATCRILLYWVHFQKKLWKINESSTCAYVCGPWALLM